MGHNGLLNTVAGLSAVTRKADSGKQAGVADLINIVPLHLADPDVGPKLGQVGMLVTPVRARNGRIKLIVWRLSEDGESLERLGDSGRNGDLVNGIAAARLSFQRVVTAVRTNQGNLKLIVWRISNGGQNVEVLGEWQPEDPEDEVAIASSELSVVTMNAGQAVAVARDGDGRLLLTNWGIDEDGQIITQPGDSGAAGDVVTEFAAARPFIGRLVTAVRTSEGRLVLQNWATPAGADVEFLGSSDPEDAGDGRQISITIGGDLLTAVRTLEGDLKLIRWNGALQRLGDSAQQGGPASRTSIVRMSGDLYMTAVRGAEGLLSVGSWRVLPNEETIQKLAATNPSDQEPVGQIALTAIGSHSISAIQDGDGRLKIIAWQR